MRRALRRRQKTLNLIAPNDTNKKALPYIIRVLQWGGLPREKRNSTTSGIIFYEH